MELLTRLPKTDLHVHLEGSITPETLIELAKLQDRPLPQDIFDRASKRFRYTDDLGFFQLYPRVCKFIQSTLALEHTTVKFMENQAHQNIRYSEVIYTPILDNPTFSMDAQLEAIRKGRLQGKRAFNTDFQLIIDVSRNIPIECVNQVVNWAIRKKTEQKNSFILGFGIGGLETKGPPHKFTKVFEKIKSSGLKSFPHAGEQLGPQIIWDTLHLLHPDRIGHGVRCVEDIRLLRELAHLQMPVDIAPLSNLTLGYYPSLAKHPVRQMIEAGLNVSLNSDDPGLMNFSWIEQAQRLRTELDISGEILVNLIRNGFTNSFMAESLKEKYLREIDFLTK